MLRDLQQRVGPYGFWICRCSHMHLHGELLHWKTKGTFYLFVPSVPSWVWKTFTHPKAAGIVHDLWPQSCLPWRDSNEPMYFLNLLVASYWPGEWHEISSITVPFLQCFLAMLVRIRRTLWEGVSLPQRQTIALLPCPHLGELWVDSPSENSKEEPPPCFGSLFEAEARRSF